LTASLVCNGNARFRSRRSFTSGAARTFEEEDVRAVFRQMFEEMGIPPETVDHLQLEYRGSVW